MQSLASVLTTSYTLEEDDLHKGNFGFYIKKNEGKPQLVFFKIDHDLFLSDSVMSHGSARFVNLRHNAHAFDIHVEDLIGFPILSYSQNHYWPTKLSWMVFPWDRRVYSLLSEVNAFSALAADPEFKQATWRSFYKHILLSLENIQQAVGKGFDLSKAQDKAYHAMVVNAVVSRQARLSAALFAIQDFRDYILQMSKEDKTFFQSLAPEAFAQHQKLCQPNVNGSGFQVHDTPLHTAIRLGNYRFNETWHDFAQYSNVENSEGLTPLALAYKLWMLQVKQGCLNKVAKVNNHLPLIIQDLLKRGQKASIALDAESEILLHRHSSPLDIYTEGAKNISIDSLLLLLEEIGRDTSLSLVMKKQLALQCVQNFIQFPDYDSQLASDLNLLKDRLNGGNGQDPDPALQYIRQLRSRLWIVRQIRGLLGGTATQVALNDLLDTTVKNARISSLAM